MKRQLLTFLSLCAMSLTVQAQDWIDVTETYVQNPSYANNSYSSWLGTQLSGYNPHENAEHYEKNYNTYQEISGLTPGKYRVSLSAFYRAGNSNNDYQAYTSGDYAHVQHAQLYATSSVNTYTTPIALASSGALSESLGGAVSQVGWGGEKLCIPNNMDAAYWWFQAGHYLNQLECEVGDDGQLTIGIQKNQLIQQDWTCIDDWKLELYGEMVYATSVKMSQATAQLVVGQDLQLTAKINPSNATYQKIVWESSNEAIAVVDQNGLVRAVGAGSAFIRAKSYDGKATGRCRVTVSEMPATAGTLMINEIMAANLDMYIDPSFNYGGFVELYNPSETTVSLGNIYVSDDPNNLTKHRLTATHGVLKAGGHTVLWFDNYSRYAPRQIDFSLDADGGTIYISDQDGQLLVSQDYPAAIARTSYARTTDGSETWGVTATPSPGATNEGSTFATVRLDAPVVDQNGQLFEGSLQICVNIPEGATLRYTTDGSTPSLANGQTSETGLFNIDKTTVYRFRLFKDGMLPSAVVTRSYILNNNYTLPIVSVVGNNADLFGADYGIFVKGNGNGIKGNGQSEACNWNTDWEHPVNFEFIRDNQSVFNQEANIKSAGGWSRAWNPHSFKLKAGKVFEGKKYFDYQFFAAKPYLRHKVLHMRNGGNDNNARYIDAAIQEMVQRSGIDVDGQCYQPTIHFINGVYKGVINMREPNNKHFALANWGIDTDMVDQFEISPDSGYVQKAGDKASFRRWYELSANAADDAVYEEICKTCVDVDEFINYLAVEFYVGGTDFPQNNIKGYRPRIENGKFRFVTFDLDFAFNTNDPFNNFFSRQYYTFNALYDLTDAKAAGKNIVEGNRIREEIELITIFLNMLQNDKFRKQFIDTYCLVASSVFEPTRCQQIADEVYNNVYPAMEQEGRWWDLYNSYNKVWNGFSTSRQNTLTNVIKNYSQFKLQNTNKQAVQLSANIEDARLFVNELPVPTNRINGYLYSPVTLRASAPAGYKFLGWTNQGTSYKTTETVLSKNSPWYYYDKGSLDGYDWKTSVNTSWQRGNAPLGYYTSDTNNGRGYNTALSYGGNAQQKYPTYYFTTNLNLPSKPSDDDEFTLDWTSDDGFVIYVNGTEAGRYLMPNGTPSFYTYASSYAPGNPESGTLTLPTQLFKRGNNVIAVEVHNNSASSTDIYWDAAILQSAVATEEQDFVSTEATYEMPANGAVKLQAVFAPIDDDDDVLPESKYPVRINEISAANSVYVNEYFKRNDWIELYNNTDDEIDVAGMYISDNLNKPQKYQIPAASAVEANYSTLIEPRGHLVIWCDKLDPLSQLHASFKLNAESGSVLLSSQDMSWCDTLTYVAHNGDQTVGLYPDGGTQLYVMTHPTIGKTNMINSTTQAFDEEHSNTPATDSSTPSIANNGGMMLVFNGEDLIIRTDEADHVAITLYTTAGQSVQNLSLNAAHTATVSTAQLPRGVYVARAKNSEGESCVIKFMRR